MRIYQLFVVLLLAITCARPPENRLLGSGSPYLLEHADNPVAWSPWDDEALERAKSENKPLIVSIGYSACHWCHVMERETFMDPEVAQIMNEYFVAVKVDREQHPEIDYRFVQASEAITGTAGWPLNGFALPNGNAFHVVSYVPKEHWKDLLLDIVKKWKNDKKTLERQAEALANNISVLNQSFFVVDSAQLRYDLAAFMNTIQSWNEEFDYKNGGLKGNMKFPMPSVAQFMLQHAFLTNDTKSMTWVTTTLDAMARGGLYDHLGGGFARYATDSLWRIPHFEKMLYDNGQLVSLYANAYRQTGNESFKNVFIETLSFIEREMTSPEGAFYSSIDADSESEEGKFYKWTEDEIRVIAGDEALKYYSLYENVLNIKQQATTDLSKNKLLVARNKRARPSTDQKIITSWNAIMAIGYIDAFRATGDQDYLDKAIRNCQFLREKMTVDNKKVFRTMFEGPASIDGFLDDYAWLARSYLELYQCTFDIQWLKDAQKISDAAIGKFRNQESPLFYYHPNETAEFFDTVIPSSNSVFAEVLLLLGEYTQDNSYTELATKAVEQMIGSIESNGVFISNWARLAERISFNPYQIAIVGDRATEISAQLQRSHLPPSIFLGGTEENLPLLENKLVVNRTMIYVCKNRTCKLPVDDPQKALEQIRR